LQAPGGVYIFPLHRLDLLKHSNSLSSSPAAESTSPLAATAAVSTTGMDSGPWFQLFRLRSTGPSSQGCDSFALAGFEIFGTVQTRDVIESTSDLIQWSAISRIKERSTFWQWNVGNAANQHNLSFLDPLHQSCRCSGYSLLSILSTSQPLALQDKEQYFECVVESIHGFVGIGLHNPGYEFFAFSSSSVILFCFSQKIVLIGDILFIQKK
jgi:hypothetical protein